MTIPPASKRVLIRPAKAPRRIGRPRARDRHMIASLVFALAFALIGGRLVSLGMDGGAGLESGQMYEQATAIRRPDVVDRKGRILATDIQTGSLFADPERVVDLDDTAEQLASVLPGADARALRAKLAAGGRFLWIARELTPRQQEAIHERGLPGLNFVQEPHRVYPAGATAAHVLGHVDVDNRGLAGIESWIDRSPMIMKTGSGDLDEAGPVKLSLDLSVQYALREELASAVAKYRARAAAGLVLDIHSGEVLGMVSLPDYDPNRRDEALDKDRFNRLTSGVFELGSIFKLITFAVALDTGVTTLEKGYDATEPIRVSSFTINDFHAKRRWLSVPEIFIYSSNIGSAKMALDVGVERHRAWLGRLGLLERVETELGPSAAPLLPRQWKQLNTMTVAFGHGLSVTPLQFAAAAAAAVNGGFRVEPTFLKRSREEARVRAVRVLRPATSDLMQYLMRLNVKRGSGKRADAAGYRVGGKTGTAEKVINGRYSRQALLTSFLGVFPMDEPQYLVMVLLDEPKRTQESDNQATAGVNAAPTVGRIVERIGPALGVTPRFEGGQRFDEAVSASY